MQRLQVRLNNAYQLQQFYNGLSISDRELFCADVWDRYVYDSNTGI